MDRALASAVAASPGRQKDRYRLDLASVADAGSKTGIDDGARRFHLKPALAGWLSPEVQQLSRFNIFPTITIIQLPDFFSGLN